MLEEALEEAGIDAKPYLREANMLDEKGQIVAVNARNSFTGLSVPGNFMGRSSVESSLAAVSEVERETSALGPTTDKLSMVAPDPERHPSPQLKEDDK